jgi:hypothetical protein
MFNRFARILAVVLLLGLWWEGHGHVRPEDSRAYHQAVSAAVVSIPAQHDDWRGSEVSVPAPAQKLLHSSTIVARDYLNAERGLAGKLVVIHCKDVRDLQGHYPPICYPGHGWTTGAASEDVELEVEGMRIPLRRYEYHRDSFESEIRTIIYGCFVMPGREVALGMETVREAASDYRDRVFGAGQIQVVFTGGMLRSEEESVARELLALVVPVIRTIQDRGAGGEKK